MTLDNPARRRGSNLFCSAPPSPPGAPSVCVWARAAMILNEVVFAARRALSLHTI